MEKTKAEVEIAGRGNTIEDRTGVSTCDIEDRLLTLQGIDPSELRTLMYNTNDVQIGRSQTESQNIISWSNEDLWSDEVFIGFRLWHNFTLMHFMKFFSVAFSIVF